MCKVYEGNAYYHFRDFTKMVIGLKKNCISCKSLRQFIEAGIFYRPFIPKK